MSHQSQRRVGLVGHGAIGSVVAESLRDAAVPGAVLAGVLDPERPARDVPVDDVDELVARADIIVEAAGPDALRAVAEKVLAAGRTLVVLSIGAFTDPPTWRLLEEDHAGEIVLCSGALGGLDIIRAARLAGPVNSARLVTRKKPTALLQPWMSDEQASSLRGLREEEAPASVFAGSARDAARLFPQNLNVAASTAVTVGGWDVVSVELLADPSATHTVHELRVDTAVGAYHIRVENLPSPSNPATSGVVPYAVLRTLRDLVGSGAPRFG
ncbi:MAG: aspartate dehydrogenase domain-containing protein [Streptosporangiaceae bacterium]